MNIRVRILGENISRLEFRILATEGDMDRSLIDKTIFNTEMDSFFEVSPISPDFIPSMDRQDSKVSTEQSKFIFWKMQCKSLDFDL